MGEKVKNFFKRIGDFFISLFNLASYTEQQSAVDKSLQGIAKELQKVSDGLSKNTSATNSLTQKFTALDGEIAKIKDGLQIELFGSLQALHTKLIEQHYATAQQKTEAKLYYTQIHNLGKDGWSEQYYQEIMELPESREEYWRTLN